MTAKLQWVAATRTAPKIRDRLVTAEDIRPASAPVPDNICARVSDFLNGRVGSNQEGRSDDKTSRSNGSNHLRSSLSMHHDRSSRALQRRHCSIRSSHAPVRGKSERGIDSTSIGRRATGSPANTGVLATIEGAPASKVLGSDGPRQTTGCQGRSHRLHARAFCGQANVYSLSGTTARPERR
jgi:hypothetical protein